MLIWQDQETPNKAYASDWKDFTFWCNSKKLNPLPALPQTVVAYLISRAKQEWLDYKGRVCKNLLKLQALADV